MCSNPECQYSTCRKERADSATLAAMRATIQGQRDVLADALTAFIRSILAKASS